MDGEVEDRHANRQDGAGHEVVNAQDRNQYRHQHQVDGEQADIGGQVSGELNECWHLGGTECPATIKCPTQRIGDQYGNDHRDEIMKSEKVGRDI